MIPEQARTIFLAAIELPESQRSAYLASACGDDTELRAAVEALLVEAGENYTAGVGPDADQTLTRLDADTPERAHSAEYPGQTIGRYTLVRLLGEGGFGTVWLAEQQEPVRRQVALKIIKLGMDTRQVIARFEAERQALAVMDHPNIAKVYDAGATDKGRPFFVMEYAEGVPFTTYCDEQRLGVRERLRLFQKVCHAVQHAHQKGIVHRDIKPSNVLVTIVDGEPSPKVIDFGIAKATEARLTEHSMFTQQGQVIGTPAYMSPEQAGLTGEDIDTRSDVYALGVLLYETVTGETPFNTRTLLSAGMEEIRRVIREVDPPKPSTRLSSITGSDSAVAQHRAAEPRKLGSIVSGDIDWIVMKALEKDRARRYQTASGFAEDIDRYLNSEPVLASPPSAGYRLRKFVRRNRPVVVAGLLVFTALVAGTVGTSIGLVRATRAEHLARQAAADAEQARELEARQRQVADERTEEARTERDKAEQVAVFLTDMLAGVGAQVAQGADTTLLRGILDKTAQRIGEELSGQPEVEAKVRSHLGDTYLQIRDFERADENMLRALELYQSLSDGDDPNVARSLGNLGILRVTQDHLQEAAAFQRDSLAMWQRLPHKEPTRVPWAMTDLANTLVQLEEYDEAERLLLDALSDFEQALGPNHEDVGVALNSIANLKHRLDDYVPAEKYYLQALDVHRAALGDDHPFVATDLHNLGYLYSDLGRLAEAIEMFEQSLERSRILFPDGHEQTASCLASLGLLYRYDDERASKAPVMLEEAISLQTTLYGGESQPVAQSYYDLGDVLVAQRRYEDAIESYGESAERFIAVYGEQHNNVAVSLQALARTLSNIQRYDEASATFDRVLDIQTAIFGDSHLEPAVTLVNIGAMHRQAKNYEAAKDAIRRALAVFEAAGYARSSYTASSYENLGRVFRAEGRLEDSADALRRALDVRRESAGPNARATLGASYALSGTLIEIEAYDEAESLLRLCLEDPLGVIDGRTRIRIQERYAELLSAAGRHAECVQVLEAIFQAYESAGAAAGSNAQQAVADLIEQYELLHEREPDAGHDAAATVWRSRLNAPVPDSTNTPDADPQPAP